MCVFKIKTQRIVTTMSDIVSRVPANRVFPKNSVEINEKDKKYIVFPEPNGTGIMLADKLYHTTGSKAGQRITLTEKLMKTIDCCQPGAGWYASEKYDGLRGVWTGNELISRPTKDKDTKALRGKVFTYVPEWFLGLLPEGAALDGEIWMGRGNFQKVAGISNLKVSKKQSAESIDEQWEDVEFMVFDSPQCGGEEEGACAGFEVRMAKLEKLLKKIGARWRKTEVFKRNPEKECPVKLVKSYAIKDDDHLMKLYNKLTKSGAEGLMLRSPNNPYEAKRSKFLLKMKVQDDAEALVKDYLPGTGKYDRPASDGKRPMLGSLRCVLPNGVEFNIGTGLTDEVRLEYWNEESPHHIPLNSTVNFSYMELTGEGIPRHPAYRGVRTDVVVGSDSGEGGADYREKIVESLTLILNQTLAKREKNYQFKVGKYKKAIGAFEKTTSEIKSTEDGLKVLREGAGEKLANEDPQNPKSSILSKIHEIIKFGTCREAEEARNDPKSRAIKELCKIPHVGEAKAIKLYETYGVANHTELRLNREAREQLTSAQLLGLGCVNEGLLERIPREEMKLWDSGLKKIAPGILTGSYRRGKETSGDVDYLLLGGDKVIEYFLAKLEKSEDIEVVGCFGQGKTQWQGVMRLKQCEEEIKFRHVDIFCYPRENFGYALLHSTGSGKFNVKCRKAAIDKGYSLSQYGLTPCPEDLELTGGLGDERLILEFLGVGYLAPEARE